MARFTCHQLTQLIVFCLYWFVGFPLLWFVVQPEFFASNVLLTVLLAILLLIIYFIIYRLIKCCCFSETNNKPNQRNKRQPEKSKRLTKSSEAYKNRVYCPTTFDLGDADAIEDDMTANTSTKPDAVIFEHIPLSVSPKEKANDGVGQTEEESQNVRFVASCSLFYDGKGRFYEYNT